MTTTIEWTDETWNPLRARRKDGTGKVGWACVRVSPGCVNCYAATQNRTGWAGGTRLDYTVPDLAKVETYLDPVALAKPLHWRAPRRIFVCSMTDLFGEWVTDSEIASVFAFMAVAQRHTFQVLTKRPERMRELLGSNGFWVSVKYPIDAAVKAIQPALDWTKPLPNVWLGTSVEDQRSADERIPHLLGTPAAVRFISAEPLLGPLDLRTYLNGVVSTKHPRLAITTQRTGLGPLRWVIVGGESGPRARPMDLAWTRSLMEQCRAAGVAVFVKQLGSRPITAVEKYDPSFDRQVRFGAGLGLRESHGRDMLEWPEDLRVREWPG